jgi:predicted secreted hydrolase
MCIRDRTYPAGWRIEIPSENLKFEITPYLADQELNLSFVYWEGAVQLRGTQAGQPVTGNGYVELTGYESSMQGRL